MAAAFDLLMAVKVDLLNDRNLNLVRLAAGITMQKNFLNLQNIAAASDESLEDVPVDVDQGECSPITNGT